MFIRITNANKEPIYAQIYRQVKAHIVAGTLAAGEAMPSIRTLAKDLRISVITTQRAYEELSKDGFLYSAPGKGFFVAPLDTERVKETTLQKIETLVEEILQLAPSCGLDLENIKKMFDLFEMEE